MGRTDFETTGRCGGIVGFNGGTSVWKGDIF